MSAAKRNELDFIIDKIDMRTGSYVEFEVMTDSGPSKRLAFDYMTGKDIIESWGDKILSYTLIEKQQKKLFTYYKNNDII